MANFLVQQLDFIFFFYGLAFILLGATCLAIARRAPTERSWRMLAAFGFTHGANEWLDLSALILGDSPNFTGFRTAVMTVSFVFLAEFARSHAIRVGYRMPGPWIHLPAVLAVEAAAYWSGNAEAAAVSRYTLGLVGGLGAAWVSLVRSRQLPPAAGRHAKAAAIAFALYGIAAGAIVGQASFWPANVVNSANFMALTGMPIQLIRGILACCIAFSAWALWGQSLAAGISSPRFSEYLRRHFTQTVAAMCLILVGGWILTEQFGDIYRRSVEQEASATVDLLESRLAFETASAEALAVVVAGSPVAAGMLAQSDPEEAARARSLLDRHVEALVGDTVAGYLVSRDGTLAATSGALAKPAWDALKERVGRILQKPASTGYAFLRVQNATVFYASRQIVAPGQGVVGAAILVASVDRFARDLARFDRPYYFVDPHGIVAMTNTGAAIGQALWPVDPAALPRLRERFRTIHSDPIATKELQDASWTEVGRERDFVRKRAVGTTGWSLVVLKPTREIFATRFVGIVITLLVAMMALIYLLGQERWMHEDAQRESRSRLQELARDLSVKATTDLLTGLSNRLILNEILPHEMARAEREETALCVVLYDIDRFKRVNDTFGHAAGDAVLVAVSKLVSDSIRQTDRVVRWGGEEFLIVLPDTNEEGAMEIAEKLRARIESATLDEVGSITGSFGVARFAPGQSMADLIARADNALYRAKRAGRNQVQLATGGQKRGTLAA